MRQRRILDVKILTWEENGNKKFVGEYVVGFISFQGPFIGIGNAEYIKDYDDEEEIFGIINHEQMHWTLWHQIFEPDNILDECQVFDNIAESIGL